MLVAGGAPAWLGMLQRHLPFELGGRRHASVAQAELTALVLGREPACLPLSGILACLQDISLGWLYHASVSLRDHDSAPQVPIIIDCAPDVRTEGERGPQEAAARLGPHIPTGALHLDRPPAAPQHHWQETSLLSNLFDS